MEIIRRKGFSSRRTNLSQESTNSKIRQEEGQKQEAACTLCWRVASPAHSCEKTSDDQIGACSPTADYGEGDTTTSRPDTADNNTLHQQTSAQATDSRDHTITDHHATNNTASFSRIAASKEAKDQVTEDYKTAKGIFPCRHRGRIPSAWEVWSPGHLRHHPQGHRESIKTAQRRRGNQYRSSCLLRLSAREQALATRQRAHQQVLRWSLVHQHRDADWGK